MYMTCTCIVILYVLVLKDQINIHLCNASEPLFVEKFFLVNHVTCASVSRLKATVQRTNLFKDNDLA
jgi:hypothetical protein